MNDLAGTNIHTSPKNGEQIDALGNEQCFDCGEWGPCDPGCSTVIGAPDGATAKNFRPPP